MKNFIEVTDTNNTKVLLNVNLIFKIQNSKDTKSLLNVCQIDIAWKGHNDYPFQYVKTMESYEEVLNLIEKAV